MKHRVIQDKAQCFKLRRHQVKEHLGAILHIWKHVVRSDFGWALPFDWVPHD